MKDDPVSFRRTTIVIEGGRKLYSYEFEIDDEGPEPARADPEPEGNLADQGSSE